MDVIEEEEQCWVTGDRERTWQVSPINNFGRYEREFSPFVLTEISGIHTDTHTHTHTHTHTRTHTRTHRGPYRCPANTKGTHTSIPHHMHIITIHQLSLASLWSSSLPSSSSSSLTICGTAGSKSRAEVQITAGTWVYHLPVEEGRRASKWEERFSSIHHQIKIHLDPLKGGGGWGGGRRGAAFGINARPLIVRPITSIWSNLKREKRSDAASGPFCCPAIK